MYRGKRKDENLDIIGDRMGIPRDIKNRHDIIKEQMRKIATQNNTLWMLSAGFATPILTALACCGLENYIVAPAVEKTRNTKEFSSIDFALVSSKLGTKGLNINTKKNDTLWNISKDVCNKSNENLDIQNVVRDIKYRNKLSDSDIYVGQVLEIPVY